MEDQYYQYAMADLHEFISGRSFSFYRSPPPPSELLANHRSLTPSHPFEMLVAPRGFDCTNSAATVATVDDTFTAAGGGFGGFGVETVGGRICGGGGGDGCAGRWPRQETLTLLEIRSRLDAKFKEANQKRPLWDEVSRILSAEHGYQRSGKKCREKFENLYKYYKKTKEGKAGRQDGKHYRFFRQLEALYGESTANSEPSFQGYIFSCKNDSLGHHNRESCPAVKKMISETTTTSLSLSRDSDSDDTNSSSDDNAADQEKRKRKAGKRRWKTKIRDFIDSKMKRLIDKQEVWTEKMMKTMEHKERERMMREEEWRKRDAARIESEHKFWAKERAWMEARDAALMDALEKFMTGKEELKTTSPPEVAVTAPEIGSQSYNQEDDTNSGRALGDGIWMKTSFQQRGMPEEQPWNEISGKTGCLGHNSSGSTCKNKWDGGVHSHLRSNKKRRDQTSIIGQAFSDYNYQGSETSERAAGIDHASSVRTYSNVNGGNGTTTDSWFRYCASTDHAGYGRILD